MSLHTLAHHLQSAGRGNDKVLVHMTPGEVKGLQSLAMAHGGSLTINPETGLPEAGFLSSILPMIAGFALGPAGLGMTAMQAGLTTAAIGAAATGSLRKGLMAGLGAYSGAGLGAGLQAMATPAVAPAVSGLSPTVAANASTLGGTVPLAKVGAENILTSADDLLMQGAKTVPVGGYDPSMSSVFVKNAPLVTTPPADAAKFLGTDATNQAMLGKMGYTGPGSLPTAIGGPQPFPADFATINPPAIDPRMQPGGALYTPDRGAMNMANQSFQPQGKLIGEFPSPYNTAYTDPSAATIADQARTLPARADYPTVVAERAAQKPLYEGINFAEGARYTPSTSNAVDVSGQSISRPFTDRMAELGRGAKASFSSLEGLKGLYAASEAAAPYGTYAGLGSTAYNYYDEKRQQMEDEARARAEADRGLIRPYTFDYGAANVSSQPYSGSAERTYFQPTYTAEKPYKAPGPEYAAKGGLMGLAAGGAIEQMAALNSISANTGYPQANLQTPMYANPSMQRPVSTNVIAPSADAGVDPYTGEARFASGGETQYGRPVSSGGANPETQTRAELAGGRSVATPEYGASSGYAYSYNPNTMQFTQTGGPGARPSDKDLVNGVAAFDMLHRFAEMQATGQPYNFTPSWAQSTATPNGPVSGGTATPVMQPAAPARPLVAPVNVPAYRTPEQQLGLGGFYNYMNSQLGGYSGYAAGGGVSHLGDYSDGGRLLKGPGDGVSDSIPASIGNRQPARLADGEFVVPARIVSEIGNGSTEAGARKLYAMMDRVQKARRKTTGKGKVAVNSNAEDLLPV